MPSLNRRDSYGSECGHTGREERWESRLAALFSLRPVTASAPSWDRVAIGRRARVPQPAAGGGGLGAGGPSQHTREPQSALWKSLSEDVYQVVDEGQRGQLAKTNIFLAH